MEFNMHEPPRFSVDAYDQESAVRGGDAPFEGAMPAVTELTASSESALEHVLPEIREQESLVAGREQINGTWQVYDQSSDPQDAYDSLLRFSMDWYTKPDDFHILSLQNDGSETSTACLALRVAKNGILQEVRGLTGQPDLNLLVRPEVVEYVSQLPGGDVYVRAAESVKMKMGIDSKMYPHGLLKLDAVLTDDEVKFLYEVDQPIEMSMLDHRTYWGHVRRGERGGQDMPALTRLIEEHIDSQFPTAYRAYQRTAAALEHLRGEGIGPMLSEEEMHSLLEAKQQEWHDRGLYKYIAAQQIQYGGLHYDVVATPSAAASRAGILALAKEFGEQTGTPVVVDESFKDAPYTDAQLAGTNEPVSFSLVPRRLDNVMGYVYPEAQLRLVQERQATYPPLNCHIPNVLEAVCRWYVLDENGLFEDTSPSELFATTHIDLPPTVAEDEQQLNPTTRIYYDQLLVGMTDQYGGYPPRIAIG